MCSLRLAVVVCSFVFSIQFAPVYVNNQPVFQNFSAPLGSKENPVASIREAFEVLSNYGGHDIFVAAGIYTGENCQLELSGVVSVRGAGQGVTVFKCPNYFLKIYYREIFTERPVWVLENFSVVGTQVTQYSAIFLQSGSLTLTNVTISNWKITTPNSYLGGGVAMSGSYFKAEGCTFSHNSLTSDSTALGGGLGVSATTVIVDGCVFEENVAIGTISGGGGGMAAANGTGDTNFFMRNTLFSGNVAVCETHAVRGGGMYLSATSGVSEVVDCQFYGNSASSNSNAFGGGLVVTTNTSFALSNCVFKNNKVATQSAYGGALHFFYGRYNISSCVFYNNSAVQTTEMNQNTIGGAVRLYYCEFVSIHNCSFTLSTVTNLDGSGLAAGGAIGTVGSSIFISTSTFTNNSALNSGSGGGAYGGAIFISSGSLVVNNASFWFGSSITTFFGDLGSNGGGVAVSSSHFICTHCHFVHCSSSGAGGAVSLISSSADIRASTFTNNTAASSLYQGGAALLIASQASSPITVALCSFVGNKSPFVQGGAVTIQYPSVVEFSDCEFSQSKASRGGAVWTAGANTTFIGCTFTANVAESGGAVMLSTAINALFILCSFFDNQAFALQETGGSGGALYSESSLAVRVVSCTFEANSADVAARAVNQNSLVGGGALCAIETVLSVTSTNFTNNAVTNCIDVLTQTRCYEGDIGCLCGGGAVLLGLPIGTFENSYFQGNLVLDGYGGAAVSSLAKDQLLFNHCEFRGNNAEQGGAWYASGGAVVADSLFEDNIAGFSMDIYVSRAILEVKEGVSLCSATTTSNIAVVCDNKAVVLGHFNLSPNLVVTCETYPRPHTTVSGLAYSVYICANSTVSVDLALSSAAVGFTVRPITPHVLVGLHVPQSSVIYPPRDSYELRYPAFQQGDKVQVNIFSEVNTRARLVIAETECLLSLEDSRISLGGEYSAKMNAWSGETLQINIQVRDQFDHVFDNRTCRQPAPVFVSSSKDIAGLPHLVTPVECGVDGCTLSITVVAIGPSDIGLSCDGRFVKKVDINVKSWALLILLPALFAVTLVVIIVVYTRRLYRHKLQERAERLLSDYCGNVVQSTSLKDMSAFEMHTELLINSSDLTILREVASGVAGVVSLGMWRKVHVAVKEFHSNVVKEEDFINEALLHRTLHHPNIVQLFGVCTRPLMTVMEWMHRGSLYHVLHNNNVLLSWERKLEVAVGAAKGMLYLHDSGIIHRDLKSLNLLLDEHWVCKVGDFGLSRSFGPTMTIAAGTMLWTAPEVWTQQGHYTARADVYSFGIVLWELLTRRDPFDDVKGPIVVAIVKKGVRPAIPADCPPAYADIMSRCWAADPDLRPNFEEVLEVLSAELRLERGRDSLISLSDDHI